MCDYLCINLKTTAIEFPWNNSVVERNNQTFANMINNSRHQVFTRTSSYLGPQCQKQPAECHRFLSLSTSIWEKSQTAVYTLRCTTNPYPETNISCYSWKPYCHPHCIISLHCKREWWKNQTSPCTVKSNRTLVTRSYTKEITPVSGEDLKQLLA